MSKQEEIRWKIITLLIPVAQGTVNGFAATDEILSYLHSQGVVIKVDRELPHVDWGLDERRGFLQAIDAGYVAVEPLIKEE